MSVSLGAGISIPLPVDDIKITMDGGGSVLTTGPAAYYTISYAGVILGWYLTGDVAGNLVIDVWKSNGSIPTVANTIAGSELPTLSSQQLNSNVALQTWITRVQPGDTFGININSVSGITKSVLTIQVLRG